MRCQGGRTQEKEVVRRARRARRDSAACEDQRPDLLACASTLVDVYVRLPWGNRGQLVPSRAMMTTTPRYRMADLATAEFKKDLGLAIDLYNDALQTVRVSK